MRQRKSLTAGRKGKLALLLAMTLTATAVGNVYTGRKNNNKVYAGEEATVYFAEGFGTGVDFNESSWDINTNFDSRVSSNISGDVERQAGIKLNEHSGNSEPIIRLIDGVRKTDLSSSVTDYRMGSAMVSEKIKMKEDSQFTAKFTISMPDACVNAEQTGGEAFAREVGGDGIAFIITTADNINGQAGSGMGYYGVEDSIVVEMDSYFNGAYCTFEETSTGYENWYYDNQIYANENLGYLSSIVGKQHDSGEYSSDYNYGEFWEKVLNPAGYKQLSGDRNRRFDHVGVMIDGDCRTHKQISYLNGLNPAEVVDGKYVNIRDSRANTPDSTSTCKTRFADEGNLGTIGEAVDNRLFTVWVEYDGTNLYVSYANGNFEDAVKPAQPQIKVENNAALSKKFAGDEVRIGFTSSIGSSKANHTVHSIEFVNEYRTEYKEKYYVETRKTPSAEDEVLTVGGKTYVLKESNVQSDVEFGSEADITDKSSSAAYKNYTLADYSALYPKHVDMVNADGTTVLYQFYDLIDTTYKVEYYYEDKDSGEFELYTASDARDGVAGETAEIEVTDKIPATEKPGYTYDEDNVEAVPSEEISPDGSTTLKVYFVLDGVGYTVEYYYENEEGGFNEEPDYKDTTRTGIVNDTVEVKDTDKVPATEKPGYEFGSNLDENVLEDTLNPDGSTILKVYFVKKPAQYRTEYWLQNLGGVDYTKAEDSDDNAWETGKVGNSVEAVIRNYTGYTHTTAAGTRESIDALAENRDDNVMKVYYNLNGANYKVEYYYEDDDGEFKKDSESAPRSDTPGKKVVVTDDDKEPQKEGYQYDGDNPERKEEDTLSPDGDTILRVYFEKIPTQYRTEYYLQNLGGVGYTKAEDSNDNDWKDGKVGNSVNAVIRTYTGYTHTTADDTKENINALAKDRDDNVMKVYYNLNAANYKVEYYYEDDNGDFPKDSESTPRSDIPGKKVEVNDDDKTPQKEGYQYDGDNPDRLLEDTLSPDGDTILKVYFEKTPTEYKTQYWLQNEDGTYEMAEETDWIADKTGKSVTAAEKEFNGYGLTDTEDTVNAISSLDTDRTKNVMKLYYNRKTVYVVEYYYQNSKGGFDLDTTSGSRDGLAGSLATVLDSDKIPLRDNYVYDENNAEAVIEKVVNADGTTTLKVYFVYKEPVEPTTEPKPTEPTPTEPAPTEPTTAEPATPAPTTKAAPIKTGDTINNMLIILLLVSGATVGIVAAGRRKKEDN